MNTKDFKNEIQGLFEKQTCSFKTYLIAGNLS